MNAERCEHVKQTEYLAALALRRTSAVGTASALSVSQDVMAACQAACGDESAYRDVELVPVTFESYYMPSGPELLIEAFAEGVNELWAWFRRLGRGRRGDARKEQA